MIYTEKFRYDRIIGFKSVFTINNKTIFEVTNYDEAFKNAYVSDIMFFDYYENAEKCSHMVMSSCLTDSIRYNIYTEYNKLLPQINKKLKCICKMTNKKYKPYKLYIVNYNKRHNGFFECLYHLHNDSDDLEEFYNGQSLKILFNCLNNYILSISPEKTIIKNRFLTKNDMKRNDIIDKEIERSYDYIETLKQLKK